MLDDSAWDAVIAPWKAADPRGSTYIANGCLECRMTGYMGRIGIYEMMIMTPRLRNRWSAATDLDWVARHGLQGRHEAAARQRRAENRRRRDHRRRSHESRAAARQGSPPAGPLGAVSGNW